MKAKISKNTIIVAIIAFTILLSSCSPKPGDVLIAKQSIQLSDGDQFVCSLKQDQKVVLNRIELTSYGSSMTLKKFWVKSVDGNCNGRAPAEAFKEAN
jgi:hypothetical protein